ncbi:MAG TPA: pilin [Candidatus Dormibacteraeota bacterium]|nr:pilin [Candidatus Dormibacteraeota bacterium]
MIQKIKNLILITLASSTLLVPALATTLVSTASADNISNSVCQGVNNAANSSNRTDCGTAGTGSTTDLSSIASKIVSIFSIVVGIIAVIMIIYGGFRYITSGGDSGKVGNAKNSLIYALVGLIIVALAQLIVHYVLNTASSAAGSSGIGT